MKNSPRSSTPHLTVIESSRPALVARRIAARRVGATILSLLCPAFAIQAGTFNSTFQEGVSPTTTYATSAVTIRSDQATTTQNSSTQIIVGRNATIGVLRGVQQFDLTALKTAIGSSAFVINDVSLSFTTASSAGSNSTGGSHTFAVSRLTQGRTSFSETGVTWNNAPSAAGGQPGILLSALAFDPATPNSLRTFPDSPEFRTAIYDAIQQSDATLRLLVHLRDGEGVSSHSRFVRFVSDEATPTSARPKLVINYTVLNESQSYPAASQIKNIKTDFGAKGDGTTDDTAAFQAAVSVRDRHIFIPNGKYVLRDQVRWPANTATNPSAGQNILLIGESRNGVILQLENARAGFVTASTPKALFWTGDGAALFNGFGNGLHNLTINTGSNNPGAIGIQYYANNYGALRNVLIKSEDGQGVCGVDMAFSKGNGPTLLQNVEVQGYQYGIKTGGVYSSLPHPGNGTVMEHVVLKNQSLYGLHNTSQTLSIRDLRTYNQSGPSVFNSHGNVTLLDPLLTGGASASSKSAVENAAAAQMLLRNGLVSGYAQSVNDPSFGVWNPHVTEWTSDAVLSDANRQLRTLNLPVKETPEVEWDAPSTWANVMDFGATGSDSQDAQTHIQACIDSGATTIYFPQGKKFRLTAPVYIRGNVRRMVAFGDSAPLGRSSHNDYVLVMDESGPSTVVVQGFNNHGTCPMFKNTTSRTLVIKDSGVNKSLFSGNGGSLFMDGVVTGGMEFLAGHKVWARQFNPENNAHNSSRLVTINASTTWFLGVKHEGADTVLDVANGSKVEVLGHLSYPVASPDATEPMYKLADSDVSLNFFEVLIEEPYELLVRETIGSQVSDFIRGNPPLYPAAVRRATDRKFGSSIALFSGHNNTDYLPRLNAPLISSPGTATATRNAAYSYRITGLNKPTSFGTSGLPAGLSVNTTTGVISGTPTATAGLYTVTLTATNATGSGTMTLSLTLQ